MVKLAYDNIFESIVKNKKKAAAMQASCDAIIDLRDVLEARGMPKKAIEEIVDATYTLTMSRYRAKATASA